MLCWNSYMSLGMRHPKPMYSLPSPTFHFVFRPSGYALLRNTFCGALVLPLVLLACFGNRRCIPSARILAPSKRLSVCTVFTCLPCQCHRRNG